MTLVVLGLDALDAALVERFDADAFQLNESTQIKTFAHSRDVPYTLEVWPTTVTGVGPEEHGITDSGTSEWGNPILELGSRLTGRLSEGTRGKLGSLVEEMTGTREELAETDAETVFDREDAVVHNWPGVHDGSDLQRAWDLMGATTEGMGRSTFERELLGLCAEQFGWAVEMLNHDVSIAGVHVHTLDAAGHAYSDNEAALSAMYDRVGSFVADLETALGPEDDLLLLSDHGMKTEFVDGDSGHSFRAFAATTTDTVPRDVCEAANWIEDHAIGASGKDAGDVDIDRENLEDLGYI
ncbi:alkaline phosphatase family protein [Halobellus inordinatus]|uniref:alkaline phosphatase family protein n=1 Tax=Halobellus inordinatus TaxID=1126236 RepID=UPI002114A9F5|nr:alkaline phosphatase family protein [Halobellus ramosii]